MPAKRKNPDEVKSQQIIIRITEEEQTTIQRWTKMAKRGHRLNDCSNISELVRKYLIPVLKRDIEATAMKDYEIYDLPDGIAFREHKETPLTPERVIRLICDEVGVTVEDMQTRKRHRELVTARQMSCYFILKLFRKTLDGTAAYIGGRDHATVLYSVRKHKEFCQTEKHYRERAERIERMLRA